MVHEAGSLMLRSNFDEIEVRSGIAFAFMGAIYGR